MDLIGELWKRSPLFLSREDFERALVGWEVQPVEEGGRVLGVFVTKGPEFHFQKFDSTPAGKRHLRKLAEVIERNGYATTRTPKEDARQLRLNAKLGFYRTGEDEYDVHQRIDALRVKT